VSSSFGGIGVTTAVVSGFKIVFSSILKSTTPSSPIVRLTPSMALKASIRACLYSSVFVIADLMFASIRDQAVAFFPS
jgi:hypothetical protein